MMWLVIGYNTLILRGLTTAQTLNGSKVWQNMFSGQADSPARLVLAI